MELYEKFKVEIVTPEKVIYADEVEMVVVPGEVGEFGVMASHIPIVSSIKAGFISLYEKGQVKDRLFVADGFVEVTDSGTVVLVDRAYAALNVKITEIEKIILNLEKSKNVDLKDFDNILLEKDIEFYNMLIDAVQHTR